MSGERADRALDKVRRRLTYANVMATIAVAIALGGTSWAALRIGSADIINGSVRGIDVRNDDLTGRDIRESRLGKVPRARNADRLGGLTAQSLRVRCPSGTLPAAGACVETTSRPAAAYGTAVIVCSGVGTPQGPGRRLPTHGELTAALAAVQLADGGELTSDVYPSSSDPGRLDVLYVTDRTGRSAITPDTAAGAKAYRCVATPLN